MNVKRIPKLNQWQLISEFQRYSICSDMKYAIKHIYSCYIGMGKAKLALF